MKLFYSPGACSLAVHIALEETKVPFEVEKAEWGNRTPDHLALNPLGSVPTLEVKPGTGLTEVAAILQYVADQKPDSTFAPKRGTWEHYKYLETLNFLATEVHKLFGPLFSAKRYGLDEAGTAKFVAAAQENLFKRLDVLDKRLAKTPFLMGTDYTFADAYLFTVLGWSKMVNVSLDPFKHLQSFSARVFERPATQVAMKKEGLLP